MAEIEELELKNRQMLDKLNAHIYQQASQYKEKTMNALNRGKENKDTLMGPGGPPNNASPLRNNSNGPGGTYGGFLNPNESAFARSPLQVNRVQNQPPYYVN